MSPEVIREVWEDLGEALDQIDYIETIVGERHSLDHLRKQLRTIRRVVGKAQTKRQKRTKRTTS